MVVATTNDGRCNDRIEIGGWPVEGRGVRVGLSLTRAKRTYIHHTAFSNRCTRVSRCQRRVISVFVQLLALLERVGEEWVRHGLRLQVGVGLRLAGHRILPQ